MTSDHFADVSKIVKLGSVATQEVPDFMLTRYACYFIAQNGDPTKEQIAANCGVFIGFDWEKVLNI